MSWHSVISIYFIALFFSDYGDFTCEFLLDFYDLNVKLLNNVDVGRYLGIILSDGLIFPLLAIVFCYYVSKYRKPWLWSLIFAVTMGLIEAGFVKHGYMVYHFWSRWVTPVITFIAFRILAYYSERLVSYNPPIPYLVRLLCAIYSLLEWPGAVVSGSLRLFVYRPHIFENQTADNRFVAVILTTLLGAAAGFLAPKIHKKSRIYFFMGLGIVSIFFVFCIDTQGYLIFNHFNYFYLFLRYMIPYMLVYLYDRWESDYTEKISIP